ncbi:helix-turn-helix domain-containing protein [Nocardiopsis tropica]|uniref:TetR/AcrR family transcriptional regulator n=1 Tax=Nocardiopsis tropica TaxID=109330 RepID=UPI002E87C47A|nr:helix-turn-helix domain-containing protein [Nocardiopsis tropica]
MPQPVEHDSPKATRILRATRELVFDHGIRKVTIAEIARAAGVGKGTVYLYWATKEDLLLDLFGRELVGGLNQVRRALAADPGLVRPGRLTALLLHTMLTPPLNRRLQAGDEDALRLMAYHTDSRDVFARAAPAALCTAVLDVLRQYGLVRQDRALSDQAYALHALLNGFFEVETRAVFTGPPIDRDPGLVLAETVTTLLEVDSEPAEAVLEAATEKVLVVFDRVCADIVEHLRSLAVGAPRS